LLLNVKFEKRGMINSIAHSRRQHSHLFLLHRHSTSILCLDQHTTSCFPSKYCSDLCGPQHYSLISAGQKDYSLAGRDMSCWRVSRQRRLCRLGVHKRVWTVLRRDYPHCDQQDLEGRAEMVPLTTRSAVEASSLLFQPFSVWWFQLEK